MDKRNFFTQLTILSILLSISVYVLNIVPTFAAHSLFSWSVLAFFILLSIVMFFVGQKSAAKDNKNRFTNTVLMFTFVKLVAGVLAILIYYLNIKPESKLFIVPFFVIYFAFTIFESYFMMKLAKQPGT